MCLQHIDNIKNSSLYVNTDVYILNMNAQGLLLDFGTLGGVVVIQSGFADGDKLRMRRQSEQLFYLCQWLFVGIHRMGAGRIEDRRMSFSNGAHLGLLAQACANRYHTVHAGGQYFSPAL